MNICENCGKEHDGSYGSGRFCSFLCKQKFNIRSKIKDYHCSFCGKDFIGITSQQFGAHKTTCKFNPKRNDKLKKIGQSTIDRTNIKNPLRERILECPNCHKTFTRMIRDKQFAEGRYKHFCSSYCSHSFAGKSNEWIEEKKLAERKAIVKYYKNVLNKDITSSVCLQCGKSFDRLNRNGSKFCSDECSELHKRKAISIKTKNRCDRGEFGGINNDTFKKHKHGWFKGIYCGSSWELAYLIYNLDKGIAIKRCDKIFYYEYEGKILRYYPDFEVGDTIVEIKGYEDKKAKEKQRQHPEILVLRKKDLKDVFNYVISKYGKNFVDLLTTSG